MGAFRNRFRGPKGGESGRRRLADVGEGRDSIVCPTGSGTAGNSRSWVGPILILGFALRVVPILWGVPVSPFVRDYHPDEGKVLAAVLGFPEIYGTTGPFPGYGTSIQYLLGMILLPVKFALTGLSGHISPKYILAAKVSSRFANVLAGVLCVYLTYLLSLRLFDRTVARISALLLSTSFYHVMNTPVFTLDVMTSLLLVSAVLLCIRAFENGRASDHVLLGSIFGLMLGTKMTLGLFLLVPAVSLAFGHAFPRHFDGPGGGHVPRLGSGRNLLLFLGTGLATYFVTNPQVILEPMKYAAFYAREKHDFVDRAKGPLWQMLRNSSASTFKAVGVPCAVLSFVGLCSPGRKRLGYKIALAAFLIAYFAFWRWFLLPRYVITIAPLLCMFAAAACARAVDHGRMAVRVAGLATVAVVTLLSIGYCVLGIRDRLTDSRPLVSRYMNGNIPPGSTVGVCGLSEEYPWTSHPWRYPAVDGARFRLMDFLDNPEFILLLESDAARAEEELNSGKLSDGFVLPARYGREWYRYSPPSPRIFRFYHRLLIAKDSGYRLVASFPRKLRVPLEFPSPGIRIYRFEGSTIRPPP